MEEAPDDSLFVKLHVKSLYNNIPDKKEAYDKHPNKHPTFDFNLKRKIHYPFK